MKEPRIVIAGIDITPDEFAKSGKTPPKIVASTAGFGGENYLKNLEMVREAIRMGLFDKKYEPEQQIKALKETAIFYQTLYREKREREQQLTEFLDFLIVNKDKISAMIEGSANPSDTRQRGKPGRHSFPEDIWAWGQVNINKCPMNEVRKEWIEKILANPVRRHMKNPKHRFNRIARPTWRRK